MILGENRVQGLDYAYTIQGWLKGVNSTAVLPTFDMGGDGSATSAVERDAFGFSLNYYNGDYKPISSTVTPFATVTNNLPVLTDGIHTGNDLFNGNIRAMLVNVPQLGNANLYTYRYDQLNRIKAMNSFTGLDNSSNLFTNSNMPTGTENYKERVTYDPNGNIRTYLRDGDAARVSMDDLSYTYKTNTNQLDKVTDAATDAAAGDYDKYNDIKRGQADSNYRYDAIGNLIKDSSEGITNIDWNVYGKIKTITKSDGTEIDYSYDVSGNRINKKVTSGGVTKTTVYVRDAIGNVMSIYTEDPAINSGHLTQTEADMYGSSRLGVWNMSRDVSSLSAIDYSNYSSTFERGNKFFELDNHLGNVLATVSDKKVGVDTNSDGVIDYDTAEVVSANDYYIGGMQLPGRDYISGNNSYRYGFNGQEKSTEVNGSENLYTAEFWEYDSRIGRRWNVDPKPDISISPYNAFAGNPILFSDPLSDTTIPTVNGGTLELSPNSFTTFDGKVRNLKGSSVTVRPAAGTLNTFTAGTTENPLTFEATFGSSSGKFLGYFNSKDHSQSFDDYYNSLVERAHAIEAVDRFEKDGLWDRNVSDNQAKWRTIGLGLGNVLPSSFIRPLTIATATEKVTKWGQGGLNLFKWGEKTTTTSQGWRTGDYMLHLPNKGTPALNWKANYRALRR